MIRSLAARLDRIREGASRRIPAESLEVMHRVTEQLEASGQAGRAVAAGDQAPSFRLADSTGREVSLEDLLDPGSLVLTFFRGHW